MTIFEQYAALQRQIKDLQAQADSLKQQIIAEMPDRTYTAAVARGKAIAQLERRATKLKKQIAAIEGKI